MILGTTASAGRNRAAPIAIPYVMAKDRMSWPRTRVSTGMTSPSGRLRAWYTTAMPVTNIASVASMNGAPRIAPTPISSECSPVENRIAMIGIIVSGNAVPTAASTDPTAPSASPSFRPNHSMPFVNSSAPARMMTNEPSRMTRSMGPFQPVMRREGSPQIPARRRSAEPSARRRRGRERAHSNVRERAPAGANAAMGRITGDYRDGASAMAAGAAGRKEEARRDERASERHSVLADGLRMCQFFGAARSWRARRGSVGGG